MRQLSFLSVFSIAVFVFICSCNKLEELTRFKLTYHSSATIPGGSPLKLLDIAIPPVPTNSEAEFKSNKTAKRLVKEIRLEGVKLTVKSPEGRDLSFLSEINVYIEAEGLDKIRLAWKEMIPDDTGSVLDLDISDKDFREYIVQDTYTLTVEAQVDKVISDDVKLDIASTFTVKAGLIDN